MMGGFDVLTLFTRKDPISRALRMVLIILGTAVGAPVAGLAPPAHAGPCEPPILSPVACENSKPGSPSSEWDIQGAGDPSIQGFATDMSVNVGETIRFKIDTDAPSYRLDIYRMGYYDGTGARKVATTLPSAPLPQNQPACLSDVAVGLVDCGNWAVSASWNVPVDAVSGIYFAKLIRADTGGASHVIFVVRDDLGGSDLLFQTSDTTWQAYNNWGGKSLYDYQSTGGQRARKVSYNRPFNTRANSVEDWVFNAEYPMVRWLEASGYDVSYSTGVDSDRRGSELLEHKVFLSVGHDEYWSGQHRANVEAARSAGVHLAFFSGNECFWKTRWEQSIDPSGTPYRTLVTYKETHAHSGLPAPVSGTCTECHATPIDPPVWTGTWRDPWLSPPADGGQPENALTGTIFMVNGDRSDSIEVPPTQSRLRFWRNTAVASLPAGQTALLPTGTLGYEWDEDLDNGFRPAGLVPLSSTTLDVSGQYLLDQGSTFGPGVATHALTLYRHASGALVFGAGTVQWSWGLDGVHDRGPSTTDVSMRQATVNLFADMGVQPATLQSDLVPASPSSDVTNPRSVITFPAAGTTLAAGSPVIVSGTASDAGGWVGTVEVSVDGGFTWRRAAGLENWTYSWTPTTSGTATLLSRAADDSGNLEVPSAGITVAVGTEPPAPGASIWPDTATPAILSDSDASAVELGVKFQTAVDGFITGLRFYKAPANTGTHVGNLWTSSGTLLATVTFADETASGWQTQSFATPVSVSAGTTYVASYHTNVGRYSANLNYFATGVGSGPLRALADGEDGGNGVYRYGASSAFPDQTWNAANYWVDVVFESSVRLDTTPPTVGSVIPADSATGVSTTAGVTVTFSEAMDPASIDSGTVELSQPSGTLVASTVTYDDASRTASLQPAAVLAESTNYTLTVRGGASGVKDLAGNPLAAPFAVSFTTAASPPPPTEGPYTLWPDTATPAILSDSDASAVELGVKFQTAVDGFITGLRFYKAPANIGSHVGNLWTSGGTLLATVTFADETASGWQTQSFATPVSVSAGTTYVASYHTNVGRYSANLNYFATGVDSGPLRALADGEDGGNGVYRYGASSAFPDQTWNAANYWVDVVFSGGTAPPADTTAPVVTGFAIPATATTLTVPITTLTATDAVGVTGYLVTESATAPLPGGPGWSPAAPASYTFATPGAKTLHAWARDAAGNVSTSRSAATTITLPDTTAPVVTGFAIPATATTLTVPITTLTATDAVGVTGYLVTESATAPLPGGPGWSPAAPASYTFATPGAKSLYAWARDAAGNVSTSRSAATTITLPPHRTRGLAVRSW